jgi:peptidyl-tRNA hydrolase
MTTKAAFSPEQWDVVLEGPPSAGVIVATAARGGMIRESIALSRAYLDARAQHGESELLDEIVAAKPEIDHTRYRSAGELKDSGLEHIREAVTLLDSKATAEEVDGYRHFVLDLASKVAAAHREEGRGVSPGEAEAIEEIATALGTTKS